MSLTPLEQKQVVEYYPLVCSIAGRISSTLPRNVEMDDVLQAGVLGLIDAIRKFDPAREVQFNTYAYFRIKGAIIDDLKRGFRTKREYIPVDVEPDGVCLYSEMVRRETFEWLQTLRPQYRIVIKMHYYDGLDFYEIGDRLGISYAGASFRHKKALEILRKKCNRVTIKPKA